MCDILVPVKAWHAQVDGTVLARRLPNKLCLNRPMSAPPVHLPQLQRVRTDACPCHRRYGGPPFNAATSIV